CYVLREYSYSTTCFVVVYSSGPMLLLHSFPTRRSSDLRKRFYRGRRDRDRQLLRETRHGLDRTDRLAVRNGAVRAGVEKGSAAVACRDESAHRTSSDGKRGVRRRPR